MNGQHPSEDNPTGDLPTASGLFAWLDEFGRRHSTLMLAATVIAGLLAALTLLAQTQGAIILYQAF